mgnify:CR=1 FL=1
MQKNRQKKALPELCSAQSKFWQFFFFSDLSSRKAGQCVDRKMLHDRSRRVESESCKKYGCVWDRDPSIHPPKANRNSSQHLIRNMVFSIAINKIYMTCSCTVA